ncbi:tuberous sclerosis 2 [Entomortierella parvispora]|uniref:Tuberous sclerosis 2 n=1 Tax=Entomortierella parvispora TaxID=205924 RepID=A0A9P3HL68_9FUNG|nr:tuberous sclerosis 2 [Entomortierella parvispora]
MSSRPKPTTSKLNSFFKFKTKETTLHETLRLDSARPSDPIDANEIVQQLLPGSNSLQSRLRTLDELSGIVQKYPFQHISELWVAVQDLLEAGVPHNARKAAWTFMTACIRGQFEDLGMLRAIFYQTINNHEIWEDFDDKLQALQELTKDGRDVYGFEKNIVRLLAHWIASSFDQAKVAQHMSQQRQGMQKSTTSLASLSSTPQLILLQKPIPHFNTTMALLINVVKFNFVFFDELEIANLLDLLHTICINAPEDTPHTIGFLDVIVRYGYVPSEGLSTFLKILCHTTLSDHYRDQAWAITVNLMKSHSAHNAVRLLCLNLRSKTESVLTQAHVRVLQGSIRLLQRSLWGKTPIDTLSVSYSTVLWSLKSAVDFKSKEVDEDIIRSLRVLLENHSSTLGDLEYEVILDILERLVALVKESAMGDTPSTAPFIFGIGHNTAGSGYQPHPSYSLRDAYGELLFQFIELYSAKSIPGITGRLMHLLASLQDHLPEETILLLLDYYHTEHQFYPYTPNWLERLRKLVQMSVIREKRPRIRSRALATALDVYESSMEFFHDSIITNVFMDAFELLGSETDSVLSSQLTTLLITATQMASEELFPMLLNQIIDGIRCTCHIPKQSPAGVPQQQSLVSRFAMSSSLSSNAPIMTHPPGPQIACRSLATAVGAIELFQHALYDPNGASRVDTIFSLLVGLAINQDVHRATRLVILDFLLCLRVDLDHRIFCSNASTIESIVAATEQLVSEETRQDRERPPTASVSSRSVTSQAHAAHSRQALGPATCHPTYNWRPLMQGRTMQASPYVISYLEIASSSEGKTDDANPAPLVGCAKVILNIPLYFTGILSVLEQEKDFEIYSFVIHRLPSQLFNKHLFCNSSEQICKLRTLLVEITTKDKIPESLRNLPLSAKRQNIHILAYRVLVILLCYNNKFDAAGCRDLVNAFVSGLQRQATCAKICIHALVVCCFELQQSMTKHLPATVQMMSQIMSTATISVHILEFLSTVARLPMLYSNFVEDDYRRVFGIALKYIQYTQSIAASPSPSTPSSAASSPIATPTSSTQLSVGARALPQYVLIMAYQVIDVWFMLQRLPERRKYVPYITRNLLMASEQGRRVDEQTETCLDMLARYSFANCGPKPKPSLMQQLLIGPSGKNAKLVTKTWLQGTSFITVRTAQSVGWAEITVRRASGTVSFLLKIENDMFIDSSDDLDITSLPGLLRMQEDALATDSAEQSRRPSASEKDLSTDSGLPLETDTREEAAQHLAAVSGLQQRLNDVRPSWLSPRSTPHHTPLHTPLHSPMHTPRHTPKASPLPSGDNTPSSSPPSRSYMNAVPSKLTFEAGHHRVQTAPTEHVAVFSSPSLHPLHDSSAPYGHSQDDGSGDVDIRESRPPLHIDPATFTTPTASVSTSAANVMAGLGRSKSASEHTGASQKTGVKHAELSRGPLGGALEQTKSLLSHSIGNIRREDVRRSISLVPSRNNSITTALGRAQRFALTQDDHRPQTVDSNTESTRPFSKAKMETYVDPSFVFMQMTSYPDPLAREVPFLLVEDDATNRALGVLDRTPVVDFHKIGVLYVGKGQSKEGEILSNTHGSSEYTKFLTGLGSLVRLKNSKIYAGGLDLEMDFDGKYAYSHQDEITQMIFHVATMMPNYPHDVNCDGKKRHIGNDWVTIVFNESGSDYDFGTISGQFNFMTVVVTPVSMASITTVANVSRLNQQYQQQQQQQRAESTEPSIMSSNPDDNSVATGPSSTAASGAYPSASTGIVQPSKNVWFKVVMLRRPDMPEIGPLATPKIVSASELASFTRQMALHANIYAQVYYQHLQNRVEYVSNWQERLRQIKRVKERLVAAAALAASGTGTGQGGAGGVSSGSGAGSNTGSSTPAGTGGPGSRTANTGGSSGSGPSVGNSSNMGLGLGLGLGGIGSASMSSSANNSGGLGTAGGGGGSNASGGQQQSGIMSLEPMLDFTRYA